MSDRWLELIQLAIILLNALLSFLNRNQSRANTTMLEEIRRLEHSR